MLSPREPSRTDIDEKSKLLPHHLDLWEHAALLYHGYEWQAAADTFCALAQRLEIGELQMMCLLNAAMIHARLGDLLVANRILAVAPTVPRTMAFTTFLVGLISYELGNLTKAEGCFELCFDELGNGDVAHNDLGMDFVLDREIVHANLRAVREAQYRAKNFGSAVAPMHGVPAELIFEAPSRNTTDHERESCAVSSPTQRIFSRLRSRERANRQPDASIEVRKMEETSIAQWFRTLRSPGLSMTTSPSALSPSTTSFAVSTSIAASPVPSPVHRSLASIPECSIPASSSENKAPTNFCSSAPPATIRDTWHNRPSTPYTARDARGDSESTRELARFIRNAERSGFQDMIPRNPRGEYEPVGELAKFFTVSGPAQNVMSAPTRPLELDAFLVDKIRRDRQLQAELEGRSLSASTTDGNRRPRRQATVNTASTGSNVASTETVPTSPDEPPEFLLPIVYDPAAGKNKCRVIDTKPTNLRLQRAASTYAGNNPHRQIRNTVQLDPIQKQTELDYTLKLLEGKIRPKSERKVRIRKSSLNKELPDIPPPPYPDGSSSDESLESVATVNFFDKVIGR
ncbi:hypothetical protein LTR09_003569 [Extremus antarcticus]|uniref:Uncharacterized protein n=1 Tax=Extremus antarcticus TaxID=702011 RepID=A0AAJ0DK47_9PEZI|nr:hypothetical protein LTR09_003569 [Extremus antarcticus]